MVGVACYIFCILSALLKDSIVIPLTDTIATPVIAGLVIAILVAVIAVVMVFVILAGAVLCMRKTRQKLSLVSQGL